MEGLFVCGLISMFFVVPFVVVALARAAMGSFDDLANKGVPAIGILLSVSPIASGFLTTNMRSATSVSGYARVQLRQVVVDIEIPGYPPYQLSTTAFVPTNLVRDVLPGATVELRVDPKKPNRIAIVGPGVAFSAAMANPAFGNAQTTLGRTS